MQSEFQDSQGCKEKPCLKIRGMGREEREGRREETNEGKEICEVDDMRHGQDSSPLALDSILPAF